MLTNVDHETRNWMKFMAEQSRRQVDYLHKIRGLLIGILIVLLIPIVLVLLAMLSGATV
jgi:hypothetical protein